MCAESFQTLSLLVFAAVDALINDWYSLDVRVLVPCAHCVDNEIYPPYYFPFQVHTQHSTAQHAHARGVPPYSRLNDPYRTVKARCSRAAVPTPPACGTRRRRSWVHAGLVTLALTTTLTDSHSS